MSCDLEVTNKSAHCWGKIFTSLQLLFFCFAKQLSCLAHVIILYVREEWMIIRLWIVESVFFCFVFFSPLGVHRVYIVYGPRKVNPNNAVLFFYFLFCFVLKSGKDQEG